MVAVFKNNFIILRIIIIQKILKEISIVGGGDIARKVSHLINRIKLFKISGYYNNKKTIKI